MTDEVLECQKRMLVDLIESYFAELLKKGKSWGDHIITSETWTKIASIVNKTGPQHKTADGWKLFYEKIKREVKEKVGAQRSYINKTGSGIPSVPLNDVDIKITSLYGKNHFDGQQGLRECGFPGRKFASNPLLNDVSETPMRSTVSETHFRINNSTSASATISRGKKRSYDSRTIDPKKCDLCGSPAGSIECRSCKKKFCVSCDDTYHRHPLRQTHNRKKVGGSDHVQNNANGQSVEQSDSGQNRGQQQADGRDVLQPDRNEQSDKCDGGCGAPDKSFECRFCNKTYCVSCDQLYHTHPRRLWHIRKKVGNQLG